MTKLSKILENCKSSGIILNKSESMYIEYLFEIMFKENYNNLLDKDNCYYLLNEFFNKSTIRYCDIEKNKFIIEKISKEMSSNVYHHLFEVGRNLHTAKRKGGPTISDVEVLRNKNINVSDGINHDGNSFLKINDETIEFDDPDHYNVYLNSLKSKNISK